MALLDDVASWLLAPPERFEAQGDDADALLAELAMRVNQAGLAISRAALSAHTLHPEVFVRNVQWTAEQGSSVVLRTQDLFRSPMYLDSPPAAIHAGAELIRCRLRGPAAQLRYPIARELAEAGATDYLALAVPFRDGRRTYVSWATRRDGGFTGEEVAALRRLVPPLALRLELESANFALRSLLAVYLGQNAARRVLAGRFRRGEGEIVHAVIWACDLRGFTSLADRRPAGEVVALLDRVFDAIGAPIEEQGGEILKFIGDAILAIFPIDGEAAPVCGRALAAAQRALQRLEEANASAEAARVGIGLALHVGEVMYGNVGTRDRLDFTVIGAAVNEAFRVEPLAKALGQALLLTEAFAAASGRSDLVPLGEHGLRGVRAAQRIYTVR